MKRCISLILVVLMMLACFAMAETTEEGIKQDTLFKSDHFSTAMPKAHTERFDMKAKGMAPTTTDSVMVKDSLIIVKTKDGLLLLEELPANYTAVTQDYEASIFSLMRFNDPEGLINMMIEEECHLLMINNLNNDWYKLYTSETDAVASMVGNLNTLSNDRVLEYARAFSAQNNVSFDDIVTAGAYTWMRFEKQIFVTVVGGQYIYVVWVGDEGVEFTEDSLADATELLSSLTLFT